MDGLDSVFSGGVDFSRINPLGLVLMVIGIIIALLRVKKLSAGQSVILKLSGLLICAGGALLAIIT